jgi:MFS family permease
VLPKDEVVPSESFDFLGMLLLSPGLALFLFGVSSIPEEGTVASARVLVSAAIGLALVVLFVVRFFTRKLEHPLIDLHLFGNPRLTVAVLSMTLFAIAFFGASLLFPQYFLYLRGETTLGAGLLLAPQGLGAMLTMPAAGILTDKIGPGKIVLGGLVLIVLGMAMFTQVAIDPGQVTLSEAGANVSDPSYLYLLGALFIMGLGMGGTMMPIMTSALASLRDHEIARGSTLMNITQQVAASIGTAIFSVLLTNSFKGDERIGPAVASWTSPEILSQVPAATIAAGLEAGAEAFGSAFVVGTILVAVCLVPAFFLPRSKPKAIDPAVMVVH